MTRLDRNANCGVGRRRLLMAKRARQARKGWTAQPPAAPLLTSRMMRLLPMLGLQPAMRLRMPSPPTPCRRWDLKV